MATENVPVYNQYFGNGVANEFSIDFPYLQDVYVAVYVKRKDGKEEKLSSDRFSFINDKTIQFPVLATDAVLGEGDILTIQRETELGSYYSFSNQRRLFPEETMNADDLSFQQIQELAREVERSVRVEPTDTVTPKELMQQLKDDAQSARDAKDVAVEKAAEATDAAERAEAAANEPNVIAVGTDLQLGDSSNIRIVSANIGDVSVTGMAIEDVKIVSQNISDVMTVADNVGDVNTIADNLVNVVNVGQNIDNVNTVASNTNNINTLVPLVDEITTVASNTGNINTVVDNLPNINTVANNTTNINTVVNNMDDINNASANAAAAAASATESLTHANTANNYKEDARKWAVGTIEEQPDGSAKYWAGQAQQISAGHATETTEGIAKIATNAEADAGTDNTTIMTPAKVSRVVSDNVGRGIVLGFDGTYAEGKLTFTPSSGEAYDIRNNFDYEIDLYFPAVGTLPDDTAFVISNGDIEIPLRNALTGSMNVNYGDMKQICSYDADFGWRWIFNARYKENYDDKAFVIPATVIALRQTLDNADDTTVPSTKAVLDALGGTLAASAKKVENVQILPVKWGESIAHEGYGWQASIAVTDLTEEMFTVVSFNVSDLSTYEFAPVVDTLEGILRIYAKNKPETEIVIPSVVIFNATDSVEITDEDVYILENTYDTELSLTSTNAVQNKVITEAINAKADTSTIPTKTSQLTNDSGYLTEHQSLDNYYTKSESYSKEEVDTAINAKDSLPVQTGNSGKFLTTDGTNASWGDISGEFVDLTSDQTIGGYKTFSQRITIDPTSDLCLLVPYQDGSGDMGRIQRYVASGSKYLKLENIVAANRLGLDLVQTDTGASRRIGITGQTHDIYPYIAQVASKSGNHVKFSDGLIIQWGVAAAANVATVTLPVAFSDANYTVVATPASGSSNTSNLYVSDRTATSFKMQEYSQKNEARFWIAIGR